MIEQIQIPFSSKKALDSYLNEHYQNNVYATPNSFKNNAPRVLSNIVGIHFIYIDVDYKMLQASDIEKLQFINYLDKVAFNKLVPQPSAIVNSGRGMYLVYKLKRAEVDTQAYSIIAKRTIELLEPVVADYSDFIELDKKCTDAGRYFRIEGSINTKNNKRVATLKTYKNSYTFNEILSLSTYQDVKKFVTATVEELKGTWKDYRGYSLTNLYHNRIKDLAKIQLMRNAMNIKQGYRNQFLFIYANTLLIEQTKTDIMIDTLLEVNKGFTEPLKEDEVKNTLLSALKVRYRFKNETVIEMLNLAEHERKHLNVFITRKERNSRSNKRNNSINNAKRSNKLAAERQKRAEQTFNHIKELKALGMSNTAIANELKVTRQTILNYIKQMSDTEAK